MLNRLFALSLGLVLGLTTSSSAWEFRVPTDPNDPERPTAARRIFPHPSGLVLALGPYGLERISGSGERVGGPFVYSASGMDANGDVFAFADGFLSKLSGETGHEYWRIPFEPISRGVRVNRTGDVFVMIKINLNAFVVRVSGDDGRILASTPAIRADNWYWIEDFAVDAIGRIAVVGKAGRTAYRILLFDAGGHLLWESWEGAFSFRDVEFGPTGDLYAFARRSEGGAGLVKYTDTGEIAWSTGTGTRLLYKVGPQFDLQGDVFVATGEGEWRDWEGFPGGDYFIRVSKVDGDTGAALWQQEVPAVPNYWDSVDARIATDPGGNVILSGPTNVGGSYPYDGRIQSGGDLFVAKLSGASGDVLWRREFGGYDTRFPDRVESLVSDANGNVLVGGSLGRCQDRNHFFVSMFSAENGEYVGIEPAPMPDRDGDKVVDICDNCIDVPNPRVPRLRPRAGLSGGQPDQDGDGFGDACDAKFVSGGGAVGVFDLTEMLASFGQPIDGMTCGSEGESDCRIFDLDGSGRNIGGPDLIRAIELFGQPPGPKCDICPMEIERGDDWCT